MIWIHTQLGDNCEKRVEVFMLSPLVFVVVLVYIKSQDL